MLPLLDLGLVLLPCLFQEGDLGGVLSEFCSQLLLALYLFYCLLLELLLVLSTAMRSVSRRLASSWPCSSLLNLVSELLGLFGFVLVILQPEYQLLLPHLLFLSAVSLDFQLLLVLLLLGLGLHLLHLHDIGFWQCT